MRRMTFPLAIMALLLASACEREAPPAGNAGDAANVGDTAAEGGATAGNAAAENANAAGGGEGAIPCPFGGTRNWKAWVNAMPGPGMQRTLIVMGEVNVGSDGYAGRLTPTLLDKSNPPIQHFDLNLVESAGAKKGWQPVRADHRPAGSYKAVVIDCHGEVAGRVEPVEEAH